MNHILLSSILFLSASTALMAGAQTYTLTEPGTLAQAVGNNRSITSLTVKGPLNSADFDFINRRLPSVTSISLTDAVIAPYDGPTLPSGVGTNTAGELPSYALAGSSATEVRLPNGITAIGDGALAGTSIRTLSIPSSVTSIGKGAFAGCPALTSVTIPSSVTSIADLAFAGCPALTTVNYSLSYIPVGAFKGCESLSKFTASTPIATIADNAFLGCVSLQSFPFSTSITTIGASAFSGSGIEVLNLQPASDATIGDWAFYQCEDLTKVTLGTGIKSIGKGAFFGDVALTEVELPSSLTAIADFLFTDASNVTDSGVLPGGVKTIGRYAYKDLGQVVHLYLPADLESIGDNAMEGMAGLDTIYATDIKVVPQLGTNVWTGVDQSHVTLRVPAELSAEFASADQWKEFNIQVPSAIDGVAVDPDASAAVKAWFEGTTLIITSSIPMDNVMLTGVGAKLLASDKSGAERLAIDTSRWSEPVYIIAITLSNGSRTALKLTR